MILYVGLDAFEPQLMKQWSQDGLLPNITALLNTSTISHMCNDGALENIATRSSMMCGKPFGDHGFFELYG
ncbi:MAG: hypothetical protein DHS20C01_22660 [marine bacterium B5-7]|nr:MAG: hypothetical protein DHS20C01_22660 [marine bacterium B5-7]